MTESLVSCLCCTYSRPVLLGEAIKCFIDQDYDNKELIVLNDQVGVNLKLYPTLPDNIRIINHPKRFDSLGQKRNYLKSLARGEYCCIWDDDDLYFKNRLSKSVQLMKNNINRYDIIKPQYALMSVNNSDYKLVQNLFHSQAVITRQYMLKYEYPNKSVGEDIDFESKAKIKSINIKPFYVYRWGDAGVKGGIHHLSGIADDKQSWAKSLTFEPYKEIKGDIWVKAEFQKDYWTEAEDFLKNGNYIFSD